MENKKKIIVSDFDGTLTTQDSMMGIIIFHKGKLGLLTALLYVLPWIILMMLKVYDNQKTKERLLYHCFGNMTEEDFRTLCKDFAHNNRHILREPLYSSILAEGNEGTEVYIVTASPEIWVKEFFPKHIHVIGTRMAFRNRRISPHFEGANCYGEEKVKRLCEAIPQLSIHRNRFLISAYGDSHGDDALLAFADEAFRVTANAISRV